MDGWMDEWMDGNIEAGLDNLDLIALPTVSQLVCVQFGIVSAVTACDAPLCRIAQSSFAPRASERSQRRFKAAVRVSCRNA